MVVFQAAFSSVVTWPETTACAGLGVFAQAWQLRHSPSLISPYKRKKVQVRRTRTFQQPLAKNTRWLQFAWGALFSICSNPTVLSCPDDPQRTSATYPCPQTKTPTHVADWIARARSESTCVLHVFRSTAVLHRVFLQLFILVLRFFELLDIQAGQQLCGRRPTHPRPGLGNCGVCDLRFKGFQFGFRITDVLLPFHKYRPSCRTQPRKPSQNRTRLACLRPSCSSFNLILSSLRLASAATLHRPS